jgi:hypothetical protein
MGRAFLLPCNHGMDDDAVGYVLEQLEGFVAAGAR